MKDKGYSLKQFHLSRDAVQALEQLEKSERMTGQEVVEYALLSLATSKDSQSPGHRMDMSKSPSHGDIQAIPSTDERLTRIEGMIHGLTEAVEAMAQQAQKPKGKRSTHEDTTPQVKPPEQCSLLTLRQ